MRKEIVVGYENRDLTAYYWDDVKEPKAVIQIIHGMQEHAKRYDEFAKVLNKAGFIVFASDLRGHGETAGRVEDLGHTNGDIFKEIVSDQVIITEKLKKDYDLPVYIFGHSYGSFITQRYIQVCNLSQKAIICGSAHTKNLLMGAANVIAHLTGFFKGNHTTAKLIEKMSFGGYAKGFEDGNWLTTDTAVFEAYKADPYCGTPFPACFYKSMFKNLVRNYRDLKLITPEQKVLLIAGKLDPVGSNGKSVEKLYNTYKKHKVNVDMILYDDERHEIINGLKKEQVWNDIIDFYNN